jgi:hypothetical protein
VASIIPAEQISADVNPQGHVRHPPIHHPMRRPVLVMRARAPLVALAASAMLGCPAGEPARDTARNASANAAPDSVARAAAAPWYSRSRTLDVTGDGAADSVRLDAVGTRPDSLRITLALVVGGAVKHREEWGSSYELALVDSSLRGGQQGATLLRAELDSVLSSVVVERLDAPGVRLMPEDSALLVGVAPLPTRRISFSYGFETTVRLAWDAPRERFVKLWSCC